MRDRLIELLNKKYDHSCDQCGVNKDSHYTDSLADYLLDNGVIVPPCKVRHTVFYISDGHIRKGKVLEFNYNGKLYVRISPYLTREYQYGKTAFRTREAAENALKERERG